MTLFEDDSEVRKRQPKQVVRKSKKKIANMNEVIMKAAKSGAIRFSDVDPNALKSDKKEDDFISPPINYLEDE